MNSLCPIIMPLCPQRLKFMPIFNPLCIDIEAVRLAQLTFFQLSSSAVCYNDGFTRCFEPQSNNNRHEVQLSFRFSWTLLWWWGAHFGDQHLALRYWPWVLGSCKLRRKRACLNCQGPILLVFLPRSQRWFPPRLYATECVLKRLRR